MGDCGALGDRALPMVASGGGPLGAVLRPNRSSVLEKNIFRLVPCTDICYTSPHWAKTHFGRGESPSHPRDGEVPLHLAESDLRHFL